MPEGLSTDSHFEFRSTHPFIFSPLFCLLSYLPWRLWEKRENVN